MSNKKPREKEYEYKGFKVYCQREMSLGGDYMTYYQIYDTEGTEVVCTFTTDETPFVKFANGLKNIVDDIIENPEDYYDEEN